MSWSPKGRDSRTPECAISIVARWQRCRIWMCLAMLSMESCCLRWLMCIGLVPWRGIPKKYILKIGSETALTSMRNWLASLIVCLPRVRAMINWWKTSPSFLLWKPGFSAWLWSSELLSFSTKISGKLFPHQLWKHPLPKRWAKKSPDSPETPSKCHRQDFRATFRAHPKSVSLNPSTSTLTQIKPKISQFLGNRISKVTKILTRTNCPWWL